MTGAEGENIASSYLKEKGYLLIERNYRTSIGEIDIIAREKGTLVFVEVKARSQNGFGPPQAAVDRRKQIKISRVALAYLSQRKVGPCPCRFDVVSVLQDSGGLHVELFRNAFDLLTGC